MCISENAPLRRRLIAATDGPHDPESRSDFVAPLFQSLCSRRRFSEAAGVFHCLPGRNTENGVGWDKVHHVVEVELAGAAQLPAIPKIRIMLFILISLFKTMRTRRGTYQSQTPCCRAVNGAGPLQMLKDCNFCVAWVEKTARGLETRISRDLRASNYCS